MFGNVPLSTDFTDTETKPNSSRTEVFNFVKSELDAVIPLLSEKKDASTYGRMNKWAALALRMKLHLNAEAWTGTASLKFTNPPSFRASYCSSIPRI